MCESAHRFSELRKKIRIWRRKKRYYYLICETIKQDRGSGFKESACSV